MALIRFRALLFTVLSFVLVHHSFGALDETFGVNGIVRTLVGGEDSASVFSLAIDGDGRIIAGGVSGDNNWALARYLPDGTLDQSFGMGGILAAPFSLGPDDWSHINSLAIDREGRIIAAGIKVSNGGPVQIIEFALARYLPDGTLDPDFGTGGVVQTRIANVWSFAASLLIDDAGRIVVAGSIMIPGHNGHFITYEEKIALARYLSDGSLDSTFGASGIVITQAGEDSFGSSIALDGMQRIVVAGGVVAGGVDESPLLVRYLDNGSLDSSFGVGGVVKLKNQGRNFSSVKILLNGKLVVVGGGVLARYLQNGNLDTSFGVQGTVSSAATSILIDAGESIVVADNVRQELSRFTNSGHRDLSFGDQGREVLPNWVATPVPIEQDAEGRIIVAGGSMSAFGEFLLARYLGNDLRADSLKWNPQKGGLEFEYTNTLDQPLLPDPNATNTLASLFWSNGTSKLENIPTIFEHQITGYGGTKQTVHVSGDLLREAPQDATHLMLYLDSKVIYDEAVETNNVLHLMDVDVDYGANANEALVLPYTEGILKDAARYAGEETVVVSSTARTAEDQARIMYNVLSSPPTTKMMEKGFSTSLEYSRGSTLR